jgi:hypothetical protein
MKRLHIVGCPRSGTTLIKELLCACFEHDASCDHEMSIFEPVELEGELYFSKQPNDIKQLAHIFTRDEELFVIYMCRDPRAVITSRHRGQPSQFFCNYRVWLECDAAAQHYLGHERFLALRYEDLVSDPDTVQQSIQAHFPFLQQRHLFSQYQCHARPSAEARLAMHELRPISGESVDKWRQHLPRIAEQFQRHPRMSDDLIRLHYEADESWLQQLQGVESQAYSCRYPEKRPRLKEWEKALRVYLKSRKYLRRRRAYNRGSPQAP